MSRGALNFDTHELRALQFDLDRAPQRLRNPDGLKHSATLIEREMRVDAAGHVGSYFTPRKRHKAPTNLAGHVSSELTGPYSAEIGIENKGAGKLGAIIAYGSVNNPAAYDPGAGPRRAMSRVLSTMADHAEHSVLGDRA